MLLYTSKVEKIFYERGVALMETNTLDQIKANVEAHIGSKVRLKANKGRKRTTVREGVIEAAYPSIFIVTINGGYNSTRKVSYCYSDILTTTVELTVIDEEEEIKIS